MLFLFVLMEDSDKDRTDFAQNVAVNDESDISLPPHYALARAIFRGISSTDTVTEAGLLDADIQGSSTAK